MFEVAEPIHCCIITFLLLIHYVVPWPLTLNIGTVSPVTWWNIVPNLNAIEQSPAGLLRFKYLTYWPWMPRCHVLLGSEIIFIKFDLRQFIRAWIIAFFDADMLCHPATLTIDPLTLIVHSTWSITWSKSVRNLSEIEQSVAAELLIILGIFARVMSRHDLDLWPVNLELLQHFACYTFKLYKIWEIK